MKINPAPLHAAQAVLIGLCFCMSVAILGTAGHTLHVFNTQQSFNPWWLPLWPQHFDSHGAKALIGSAVTVMVLSAIFLVFALVPRFNPASRYTFRAALALGTALPGGLATLCTVVYAHILNNNSPELDTIQTWTCKYKSDKPMPQDMGLPSGMGNGAFESLCTESKFAIYGTLVTFLLLAMSLGVSIVAWLADKWAARQRGKEWTDQNNVEMASQVPKY
ncbi:uncharacterized protein BDZ99DRAFT_457958 [Mytilinidion resinicola]|uniref:Uncharacterized protein n=1 Tax=Mytilinidion resinicola TaxID=574789 RepID=A0A6A6Z4T9_9PEZI|nr:uncharacterized protein BDZ99DRAFT_457958 [Mytilinidion resinicola]KAF2816040.1 hypothetical protein BDZ99DRAFT_457958 [Mytilinidion resinicola]